MYCPISQLLFRRLVVTRALDKVDIVMDTKSSEKREERDKGSVYVCVEREREGERERGRERERERGEC